MNKPYLLTAYTREPTHDKTYEEKLAYSMHLTLSTNGGEFISLNHNFGILFAKATQNENRTLNPKSLKNPYIINNSDGSYGIIARRTEADGSEDKEEPEKLLYFETNDFLHYEEIDISDPKDVPQIEEYENFDFTSKNSVIEIPSDIAEKLINRLITPSNIKIEVPEKAEVKNADDVKKIKAKLTYSDNTSVYKKVKWDLSGIDFSKKGEYEICGEVYQKRFVFPLAENRADPMIIKWEDKYYFIATNDADGNNSISVRTHENLDDVMDAPESEILNNTMYEHMKKFFWAPEFHVIGGELYILIACSPKGFGEIRSHIMKLKKGMNPSLKESWETPVPVVKKDGRLLCESGITLDMTSFDVNGETYVVWAEREFVPNDLGSWLYIAKLDLSEPHKLATDPVLISMPEYGWANNHTFVDEGPFALIRGNKIYLTFSSALVDYTYCVGLMTADINSDLLIAENWVKCNYPLMTQLSSKGESGTGHNAYIEDEDGNVWNTYHARPGLEGPRSTGIRRVHFTADGFPLFDLEHDNDINPKLKNVKIKITVA